MTNRRRNDDGKWLIYLLIILLCIYLLGSLKVDASEIKRATCYTDSGVTASGVYTRPGIMAAKPEWLGKTACVNAINEDGSIGEFIGYYEILDTGYGKETGQGNSKIIKGKTLGTIETGETVDIYMPTLHQAEEWIEMYGDYVYVTLVDAEG